jgi:hypothetical protein
LFVAVAVSYDLILYYSPHYIPELLNLNLVKLPTIEEVNEFYLIHGETGFTLENLAGGHQ